MFKSKIVAFGHCVADKTVTNDDLSKLVETSDEWISSRTGIRERRISSCKNTSDLCVETGNILLKRANISPEEIDIIIIATVTPDYLTPSTACIVQGALGAVNAVCFDINAACSGFVYGLSIAEKFIAGGAHKNIMLIGAETISKIVNWQDRNTCVLFGDGAGGVLLSQSNTGGIIAEDMHSDGRGWKHIAGGEVPLKNMFVKASENINRFIDMDGRAVFNFATRNVPKSVMAVLEKANMSMEDISLIVPHQANKRIIEIVAKKLKLPLEKFYLNTERFGNTSSASIPIALSEMSERGLLRQGDKIIVTGFGGGLTWGSVLIEI